MHALCRARVVENIQRGKGTRIAEHLQLVLSVADRQERWHLRRVGPVASNFDSRKLSVAVR